MKARELITVPRMPPPPIAHSGNPFTTVGDVVLDCSEDGCGWHAMGPRKDVKKAWDEHYRQHHSQEVGVVLLNQPRQ